MWQTHNVHNIHVCDYIHVHAFTHLLICTCLYIYVDGCLCSYECILIHNRVCVCVREKIQKTTGKYLVEGYKDGLEVIVTMAGAAFSQLDAQTILISAVPRQSAFGNHLFSHQCQNTWKRGKLRFTREIRAKRWFLLSRG